MLPSFHFPGVIQHNFALQHNLASTPKVLKAYLPPQHPKRTSTIPLLGQYREYRTLNGSNIIKYFKISLCSTKEGCFGSTISSKKMVKEPTTGMNEAKICPKIAENASTPI